MASAETPGSARSSAGNSWGRNKRQLQADEEALLKLQLEPGELVASQGGARITSKILQPGCWLFGKVEVCARDSREVWRASWVELLARPTSAGAFEQVRQAWADVAAAATEQPYSEGVELEKTFEDLTAPCSNQLASSSGTRTEGSGGSQLPWAGRDEVE